MTKKKKKESVYGKKYIGDTYKSYKEEAGEFALPRKLYILILRRVFWKIARSIIVDKVEWLIPNGLGSIRIVKSVAGPVGPAVARRWKAAGYLVTYLELTGGFTFRHYWEHHYKVARFKGIALWTFEPSMDQREKLVGSRGLHKHVIELALDPKVPNYDVVRKVRRVYR